MDNETQFDLLDPPISRRNDPITSKLAETRQNLGPRAKRQRQVLELVGKNPYMTAGEYARIFVSEHPTMPIKIAAETPHKRISDLMHKGLVEKRNQRVCSDSGYECATYQLTQAGMRELENRCGD